MKRSNKVISVALSVLMLASLLLVPAAAEQEDPYASLKDGIGYLAIGDSFTRGYGAGDSWEDHIYLNDTYGHDAVSTAYILDLLGIDDGYRDEEFTYDKSYMMERYDTDLKYFGDPMSYAMDGISLYGETGEIMSVRDMIKNASLITIGLGQTDVIYKAQIFGFNTLDLSDVSSIPAGIANILSMLYNYFDYWKDAYPLLLDYIKENNPDARVILVGTLNPIKDATLNDDVSIKIGSLINFIMDTMNTYTKQCALKYGYTYIDITDVDTPASVTTMSLGHILSISDATEYALIAHPTPHGYEQIAEKIIAAVEKDLAKEQTTGLKGIIAAIVDWFKAMFAKLAKVFSSLG